MGNNKALLLRSLDCNNLGQVFTDKNTVNEMLSLRKNFGSILEPSVGEGSFLFSLEKSAVGVEIDRTLIKDDRVIFSDFFTYSTINKFNTIIGNPPYVAFNDIRQPTKDLLNMGIFNKRTNLCAFFINKCIDHLHDDGELIFITPRSILKSTSLQFLNEKLYKNGSFTHYYDLGDERIFKDASPNCAVWRWQKGKKDKILSDGRTFCCRKGIIWFGQESKNRLGDIIEVKVGAVSGLNDVFVSNDYGDTDMVFSKTAQTGNTRKVIYNKKIPILEKHKEFLINRKGAHFNESNWWEWERKFCDREGKRIYVNCKTRNKEPFFVSDVPSYEGTVLALFPKKDVDIDLMCYELNRINWDELGFMCGNRYLFTQRSLENAYLEKELGV